MKRSLLNIETEKNKKVKFTCKLPLEFKVLFIFINQNLLNKYSIIENIVQKLQKIKILPSMKLLLSTVNQKKEIITENDIVLINYICKDVLKLNKVPENGVNNYIIELPTLRRNNKVLKRLDVLENCLYEYIYNKYEEYMKSNNLDMYYY